MVARRVKKFSWAVVPGRVTRELLSAAYAAVKDDADIERLKRLEGDRLVRQAEKVFGVAGIAKSHWDVATPVLRRCWLPLLPAQDLVEFARMIQLDLMGAARRERLVTKSDALAFLEKRRANLTFKVNLMKAFARLNKVERTVEVRTTPPQPPTGPSGPTLLAGRGERDPRTPYEHQELAWHKLDQLAARTARRAGLLVLPTGAGKTYTMVVWLLRLLSKDPELRVLWIADQQELVEQAARVFLELGPTLPVGTSKQIRILHGAAESVAGQRSHVNPSGRIGRRSVCHDPVRDPSTRFVAAGCPRRASRVTSG